MHEYEYGSNMVNNPLEAIVDDVEKGEEFVITKDGKRLAVIIDADKFDELGSNRE